MTERPQAYVIDASVAIKLFVVETLSERADLLFEQLAAEPHAHFYVPDLFFVECANILWKHVRRFGYSAGSAHQNIADLRALALRSISTADLIAEALTIALALDITIYDACYVALASQLDASLVTADEALVRKLGRTKYGVVWLGDFAIPSSRNER